MRALALASLVWFAVACGGAEPSPATPSAPPAAPAPAAASAPQAASAPAPEPDPERLAPIARPSKADVEEYKAKCAAFGKAVTKAAEKGEGSRAFVQADALQAVASAPIPGMKDDQRARCAQLFKQDLDGYLVDSLRVGATGNLAVLAHLMDQAIAREGKLCPSTPPVPRKFDVLAKGSYTPTTADYADPAWACLQNAAILDKLLAQLRIVTDTKAGTVTLVARTMPFRDGKMMEYVREGRVEGLKIVWGQPEAR